MFQKYFFICNYALILIVAIIYYSKLKESLPLKMFVIFLGYSLITEVLGTYFAYNLKIHTGVIYNTWNLVNYTFYTWFFLHKINAAFKRRIMFVLLGVFMVAFFLNAVLYQDYMKEVFRYNIIAGKLFTLLIVMMYFTELLKSDIILNLGKSMFFWISLAVLIYAVVFIPVYVIGQFIDYTGIYRYVTIGLNIIMGMLFITGFIVSKKEFNR